MRPEVFLAPRITQSHARLARRAGPRRVTDAEEPPGSGPEVEGFYRGKLDHWTLAVTPVRTWLSRIMYLPLE